jgi:hypothetical protein
MRDYDHRQPPLSTPLQRSAVRRLPSPADVATSFRGIDDLKDRGRTTALPTTASCRGRPVGGDNDCVTLEADLDVDAGSRGRLQHAMPPTATPSGVSLFYRRDARSPVPNSRSRPAAAFPSRLAKHLLGSKNRP